MSSSEQSPNRKRKREENPKPVGREGHKSKRSRSDRKTSKKSSKSDPAHIQNADLNGGPGTESKQEKKLSGGLKLSNIDIEQRVHSAGEANDGSHQGSIAEGQINPKDEKRRNLSEMEAEAKLEEIKREKKRTLKRRKERRRQKRVINSEWSLSRPIGGKFIDSDPIFSRDEKYLVAATEMSVNTYSTSTSQLEHSFLAKEDEIITGYCLSSQDSNHLWILTFTGNVYKWDFTSDKTLGQWKCGTRTLHIASARAMGPDEEIVFTVEHEQEHSTVRAWKLGIENNIPTNTSSTIYISKIPISSIQLLEDGDTFICATFDSLVIGTREQSEESNTENMKYEMRDIKFSEAPSCFIARPRSRRSHPRRQRSSGKSNVARDDSPVIDVAVGNIKGPIIFYEDMVSRLLQTEHASGEHTQSSGLNPKYMHWHHTRVAALAWSTDGNYIISGGQEPVLVLWQLETGKKQFLPRLESPIESLVVSPSGSSYAIALADNSLMVLSTSEMTPTAHIGGIQALSLSRIAKPRPKASTINDLEDKEASAVDPFSCPMAVNPAKPHHLLIAVPAHQSGRKPILGEVRRPYLQNYDVTAETQISSQALTRTNANSNNFTEEGRRILEPDVKHLQISKNGRWLATVDEWSPPPRDLEDLEFIDPDVTGNTRTWTESILRFWAWHDEDKSWVLNTRIDGPHQNKSGFGDVLDLSTDPSREKFATIGTDSVFRTWTRKIKLRNGQVVGAQSVNNQKSDEDLSINSWWALEFTVPLETSLSTSPLKAIDPSHARIAYSNDASVVAIYQAFDQEEGSDRSIYFVDSVNGTVHGTRSRVWTASHIEAMSFLGRYLICVNSNTAFIWDVASFNLLATTKFDKTDSRRNELMTTDEGSGKNAGGIRKISPRLAVNVWTSTFAIAFSVKASQAGHDYTRNFASTLKIFSLKSGNLEEVHTIEQKLPRQTMGLASLEGVGSQTNSDETNSGSKKGYILLDVGAEVRLVQTQSSTERRMNEVSASKEVKHEESQTIDSQSLGKVENVNKELEEIEAGEQDDSAADHRGIFPDNVSQPEDTRPVVRREHLADAFDFPSHAMPPVENLFHRVVGLFAEKPPTTSVV